MIEVGMRRSVFFACALLSVRALVAQDNELSFSLTSDFAYQPKSAYEAGGSHFSAVEGIYRSVKARTRFDVAYAMPFLVRDNPLQRGNHLTFIGSFELSPVSVLPQVSVQFSPAAMLEFKAGGMAGSGWNLGTFSDGIAEYNEALREYRTLTPFSGWYLYGWASATVQFDLAAVWPGDWHHVVALAEYTVGYEALTGTDATLWSWRTTRGMADGWTYKQYYVIGYRMPMRLSMVAVTAELTGHFDGGDYGKFDKTYDGAFMSVTISPTVQVSLTKKDDVYLVGNISARRSFSTAHDDEDDEPQLVASGREWFLDFFAVRWVHRF